jgi:hypothetical protein
MVKSCLTQCRTMWQALSALGRGKLREFKLGVGLEIYHIPASTLDAKMSLCPQYHLLRNFLHKRGCIAV